MLAAYAMMTPWHPVYPVDCSYLLSASGVISQEEPEITYTVLFSILEARLRLGLVLAYPYFWPIARVIVKQILRGSLKTIVQCIFASRVAYPYSYASHPTTQRLFTIGNPCVSSSLFQKGMREGGNYSLFHYLLIKRI